MYLEVTEHMFELTMLQLLDYVTKTIKYTNSTFIIIIILKFYSTKGISPPT